MSGGPCAERAPVWFDVLGHRVRLGRAAQVVRSLLGYHYHRPDFGFGHSDGQIVVNVRAAPRLPAALRVRLPVGSGGAGAGALPTWWREEGACALVLLGSQAEGVVLRLRPGRAYVHAWGRLETSGSGQTQVLLAFQEALMASGLLPLHCAAAVAPGEVGATAFLAPAGTGKSTMLVRAAQAGWDPVCEDLAWFDPAQGVLHGWDRGLRLLPDVLAAMEPVASEAVIGEVKRLVPYAELERLYRVRYRPAVPLARLVLLRRDEGRSRWAPLERVVAVPMLWEATGLPLTQRVRDQVASRIAWVSGQASLATLHSGALSDPLPSPTE